MALQGIRDPDVCRQVRLDLGMLALVVLEHRIEWQTAACTVVGISKSVAEVPNRACTDAVNRSCPNHHVVVCQFYLVFRHWTCPWLTLNWLLKRRYRPLLLFLSKGVPH